MSRTVAPYGSWASPISSSLLTSSVIGFSEVNFSNGSVYWLEARPEEAGRVVLVRCPLSGKPVDLLPPVFNARTRAHEYGGGAFAVLNDTVFFSNFKDQRLYRKEPDSDPIAITPEAASPGSLRYADGRVTPDGTTLICVRERHEKGRETIHEIVAVPADGVRPA